MDDLSSAELVKKILAGIPEANDEEAIVRFPSIWETDQARLALDELFVRSLYTSQAMKNALAVTEDMGDGIAQWEKNSSEGGTVDDGSQVGA